MGRWLGAHGAVVAPLPIRPHPTLAPIILALVDLWRLPGLSPALPAQLQGADVSAQPGNASPERGAQRRARNEAVAGEMSDDGIREAHHCRCLSD